MFSAEHAIPYLLSIGLLSPGDVVDGRTRLTPLLTRNYTLLATVADVPRFVLKQARATTRETLVHETRVCRALAASSDAQVKQIAPGVAALRRFRRHSRSARFPRAQFRIDGIAGIQGLAAHWQRALYRTFCHAQHQSRSGARIATARRASGLLNLPSVHLIDGGTKHRDARSSADAPSGK